MYLRNLKKHYNSHNTTSFSPIVLLISLLSLLVVSVFFYKLAFGWYPAKYTESAHGDSTSGVNSSGSSYGVGNCAHCHHQHASIEGTSQDPNDFGLFYANNPTSQDDNFCFQCHDSDSSVQVVINYSYSKTFGGGSSATPNDIKDAFNASGSTHNLADIQSHIIGRGIGFTSDENACCTCHDVHIAQKNSPVEYTGRGGVKTAVRTLSCYAVRPTNLYGDEDAATSGFNERTRDATARYQAPYQVGKTTYEPDGLDSVPAGGWGSNLPNYKAVCALQCHNTTGVSSTEHGTLEQIDWGLTGDWHGKNHQGGAIGASIAPYTDPTYDYVLACTDCHEPHGSSNEWLLRTCVNGTEVSVPGPGRFWYWCRACHTINQHWAPWDDSLNCRQCHQHGSTHL